MAARYTGYEPLARAGHAAVTVDNKLHLWGGWAGSKEKSREVAQKTWGVWHIHGAMGAETNPWHSTTWTVGHCICSNGVMSVSFWRVYMVVCPLTTPYISWTSAPFSGSGWGFPTPPEAHRERVDVGWCPMVITSWWSLLGGRAVRGQMNCMSLT